MDFAEEFFIVSQKFRTAQHQAGFGEQCFYSGSDMYQLLMVEKPGGCGKDVGLMVVDLVDNHSCIFVDGGRYDFPFYRRVCHDCACRAGSANEEWAYELFRSIQRIFIFLFLVYSVGKDNSFSVNVRW